MITTNLLSRGFDVPEVQLVINFDVPLYKDFKTKKLEPDMENYMHRIGRAGRFGVPGIALNLYDRDEDEVALFSILDFYKMKEKVMELKNADEFKEVLEDVTKAL